jgi:hypothetical protein
LCHLLDNRCGAFLSFQSKLFKSSKGGLVDGIFKNLAQMATL